MITDPPTSDPRAAISTPRSDPIESQHTNQARDAEARKLEPKTGAVPNDIRQGTLRI